MSLLNLAQDIRDVRRFEQILHVLFKHHFGFILKHAGLKHFLPLHMRLQEHKFTKKEFDPVNVRRVFEDLDGTFIKLGQLLSVRPDLIPAEYCDELSKLQDNVKPFSSIKAKEIVDQELKKNKKKFAYFNKKPIAAASIGQVHEAILISGEKVVVKVQRPNLDKIIQTDIDLLYKMAHIVEEHFHSPIIKPGDIVAEFEKYTKSELDYVKEGKNLDKLYKNFLNDRTVKIPKVYWQYSTKKILTTDFIRGIRLSNFKKLKKSDAKEIASNIANAVFKQVFIHGFFHADPHPGNILVLSSNRIAFLDSGIVGTLNESLKQGLTDLFIGLMDGNLDGVVDALLNIGVVEETINIDRLKEDIRDSLGEYYSASLKDVNLAEVLNKCIAIAKKYNIKMPINFILLGKSIVTLEGVCSRLDPDFDIVKVSRPFVDRLFEEKMKPEHIAKNIFKTSVRLKDFFIRLPERTTELMYSVKDADKKFGSIDRDIRYLSTEINRSSGRLVLGLVTTGLLIGSAFLYRLNPKYSNIGFIIAFILLLLILISLLRNKRGELNAQTD